MNKVSYSSLAEKHKVNPKIEAVLSIEDILMTTELNWSISYEPSTKSYTIFIADLSGEETKPKQDLDDEPVFDTEFIFDTSHDTRDLVRYMTDKCEYYGLVTVRDLYDYIERSFPEKESSNYGWLKDDVDKLYFEALPFGGYMLKIAKPKRIC